MSAVSLLPSGPEPVPAATGRHSLRNFDTWPSTSWDEVSTSEYERLQQVVAAFVKLRPPRTDGFGLQVTPSHPG